MEKERFYTEVWGDTVDLKELFISCIIGSVLTMTMYIVGRSIFNGIEGLDVGLAKGYSLMFGILGCIASGVICAKMFKPKRIIEEKFEEENIEDILKAAGMTLEEEIEAISKVSPEIIKEMEELELYSLLSLIPEDSPNYKPIYKEKMKEAN